MSVCMFVLTPSMALIKLQRAQTNKHRTGVMGQIELSSLGQQSASDQIV